MRHWILSLFRSRLRSRVRPGRNKHIPPPP